jgi:hypothetical protein
MPRSAPDLPDARPPADLLLARDRARAAFRQALLVLQAAAATQDGVTRAMEEECAAVRAAWRNAEAALEAFLAGAGRGVQP